MHRRGSGFAQAGHCPRSESPRLDKARRTCAAAGRKQPRALPERLPWEGMATSGARGTTSVGVAGSELLAAPTGVRGVAGGEVDAVASTASWPCSAPQMKASGGR